MALAAKKERKYLGLVHMDLRQKLTPYHAYAMARQVFEAELLDPRDFKKSSVIPPRQGWKFFHSKRKSHSKATVCTYLS